MGGKGGKEGGIIRYLDFDRIPSLQATAVHTDTRFTPAGPGALGAKPRRAEERARRDRGRDHAGRGREAGRPFAGTRQDQIVEIILIP